LSPSIASRWKIIAFFPSWPWHWWAIGALSITLALILEGSYRVAVTNAADETGRIDGKLYEPERDVWISDAMWRVYSGKWLVPKGGLLAQGENTAETARFRKIIEEDFRQRAFDGKLPIWAKLERRDIWDVVPTHFWRDNHIDYLAVVTGEDAERIIAVPEQKRVWAQTSQPIYRLFMTSKSAVEILWSRKSNT
jgi:hypothetical protein